MTSLRLTRRQFLRTTAAAAAAAAANAAARVDGAKASETPRLASDRVPLGRTGLKMSRLGLGAGSNSGEVQRALGQEGFNRLVRHAFDRGITYLDTADGYHTHTWIREALRGLPRERFFILTKMGGVPEKPLEELDRYRKELGVDVIDCVLLHCLVKADWAGNHKPVMDALEEARVKGLIRSHGVSCHSLPAHRKASDLDWVQVQLVRINPQGQVMDTEAETWFDESTASHVPAAVEAIRAMRARGKGVIGMKLVGDGAFRRREDREKSMRFAMQPGLLDAAVVGCKSTGEIDEAIENMNRALAGG